MSEREKEREGGEEREREKEEEKEGGKEREKEQETGTKIERLEKYEIGEKKRV